SCSAGAVTACLPIGCTRESAAGYSFLLPIPAALGSVFYQLVKRGGTAGEVGFWPTLLATLVAFAVGYVVIIAFLKIVSTYSYRPFVYYRIGLAALVVILLLAGVLTVMPAAG